MSEIRPGEIRLGHICCGSRATPVTTGLPPKSGHLARDNAAGKVRFFVPNAEYWEAAVVSSRSSERTLAGQLLGAIGGLPPRRPVRACCGSVRSAGSRIEAVRLLRLTREVDATDRSCRQLQFPRRIARAYST
jgi:hypothetical protein